MIYFHLKSVPESTVPSGGGGGNSLGPILILMAFPSLLLSLLSLLLLSLLVGGAAFAQTLSVRLKHISCSVRLLKSKDKTTFRE